MMMPDGQLYDNVGVDDILVVALIFDFGLPTLTQAGQLSRKRSCWVWSALRIVGFSDDYDGTAGWAVRHLRRGTLSPVSSVSEPNRGK